MIPNIIIAGESIIIIAIIAAQDRENRFIIVH